jgi:hypothetical protein
MRSVVVGTILAAIAAPASMPLQAEAPQPRIFDGKAGPALRRFPSAAAFARYVKSVRQSQRSYSMQETLSAPMEMAIAPAPLAMADSAPAAPGNPEITNNQNVGVDEGGIVKQIGRHLVMLQDGRVFAVDLGTAAGDAMRLTDRIDVYRSEAKAASWYDEMLVLGDRVLITAYNYNENASEITVLRLSPAGKLRREGRFLLSSNDYYSTENYATRLVGDSLVFYAPLPLATDGDFEWPRIRRAMGDGEAGTGDALIRATDVYAPPGKIDDPVLHTVSVCPLKATLDCRTTAFVGAPMREFYVSPADAFLWIGAPDGMPWAIDYANRRRGACPGGQTRGRTAPATLYRLPLDGGPVGALAVDGVPADQFAFDSKDGRFRALLSDAFTGCRAAGAPSNLALLDVPLSAFGARLRHVAPRAYVPVPGIAGGQLENRFVGDWLIYGGRDGWSSSPPDDTQRLASHLFAVPLADPWGVRRLALPHNAIRIERAGMDAVVTGYRNAEGLSLSYITLDRDPRRASTALLPGRFESEGRSHAFNAWVPRDGTGLLGIPTTRREWRSGRGWSDSESSDLSFVAIGADRSLAAAGELRMQGRKPGPDYVCKVSCVDWYGNSRPIFTGGRIFALMGTELVEGRLRDGRIREAGRVDLTGRPLS